MRNLEQDLIDCQFIKNKCRNDDEYARNLYRALCNSEWYTDDQQDQTWSCSWRYAGGIVANLRATGEDYMSFYCSGSEGSATKEIMEDLEKIGWKLKE